MANLQEITGYCIAKFDEIEHELNLFKDQVRSWFETHPKLFKCKPPLIHSVKDRLKDRTHLSEKISRKLIPDPENHQIEIEESWEPEEIFRNLTDLAGVRVLLLHQKQFESVHREINKKIDSGDWVLYELPKAYTWDPDSADYFEELGITTKIKDSHYTSVHYVIRPRKESLLACEIQIRTLFEEIWGEVDHILNYPNPTDIIACREQLRVLAKVVGAGSRLVDSIFNSAELTPAKGAIPEQAEALNNAGKEAPANAEMQEPIPPTEKPAHDMEEGAEDLPEAGQTLHDQ